MDIVYNKGIVPYLGGGLGNQLFVLAAGYSMSKQLDCPLYILSVPPEVNKHNTYKIDYTVFYKYLGTITDIEQSEIFMYYLEMCGYTLENINPRKCFEKWSIHDYVPGFVIRSYCQYYPEIGKFENEIRANMLKGFQDIYKERLIPKPNTAFLHVRRGDYVDFQHIHYLQPIEYYKKAINKLYELNPAIKHILLFSDDIEWLQSNEFFKTLNNTSIYVNTNEIETFCEMISCQGGAICANSTFSWWGAFLGTYGIRNPVVVPQKWHIDGPTDLFPKEWIVL